MLVYSIYATNQLHTPDFSVISGVPAVSEPGSTADPGAQRLHLQYEPGSSSPSLIVKSDTLNGHYEGNLFFVALQNVTIQLNGKYVPLETAIREEDISVEEIVAYARVDARNGFCAEKGHTENGLSQFTYDYGDYRINTIDDVYETPDGQSHRIKAFAVMASTVVENESYGFFYEGNGDIDREDWGIRLVYVAPRKQVTGLPPTSSKAIH